MFLRTCVFVFLKSNQQAPNWGLQPGPREKFLSAEEKHSKQKDYTPPPKQQNCIQKTATRLSASTKSPLKKEAPHEQNVFPWSSTRSCIQEQDVRVETKREITELLEMICADHNCCSLLSHNRSKSLERRNRKVLVYWRLNTILLFLLF